MEATKEKFLMLQTRADVAELLEIEEKSLRYFLYVIKPENMYHEFTIEKKTGGSRTICAPDKKLKTIQRKLANVLNCVYKVKPAAHGFVQEKDIVTNAKNHIKRRYVLNLDLEDFFNQINFGRVRGMLMKPPYGIGVEAATVIAQIACYKGRLPQGAPSSPILTNMICAPLDTQLTRIAMKYKLRYSRYADDITFSSPKEEMPKSIVRYSADGLVIGKEVRQTIQNNGFNINDKKTRMFDNSKRQEVTGLTVNRFVNVRRSYIKEIRAILDHCKKTTIYDAAKEYIQKGKCKKYKIAQMIMNENDENKQNVEAWFIEVLKGRLQYIRHIKGKNSYVFIKYAKELNELCEETIFKLETETAVLDIVERSIFILESQDSNNPVQGSGFIVKDNGLFTNYHVTKDNAFYNVKTYKGESVGCINNELNLIKSSEDIDYAIYNWGAHSEEALELGTSKDVKIGSNLIMIGYPNYIEGNSPDIQTVIVTGTRMYMKKTIYTVSGKVIHGASGGVVLDNNYKVVGIIRCGPASLEETENNAAQGFIPIDDVINDLE